MDTNLLKISELTQIIAKNENDIAARLERAEILLGMNMIEDAKQDIDFAISASPENGRAYKLRGAIKMNTGDKAGAAEDLRKAMELDPEIVKEIEGTFKQKLPSCH